MNTKIDTIDRAVKEKTIIIQKIKNELNKVIVGQESMIDSVLTGVLCDGHILLEGVPGLAKTLTVSSFASCMNSTFTRIQFTPDLLPADIIGTLIYNQKTGEFETKKGPIFSNIILADEINRAPAKVQSALLEAMQERQVSIGGTTYKLDAPFLVMATENPIEQEGTYPLPEAQVDRFMLKARVDYPTMEEEKIIMNKVVNEDFGDIKNVINKNELKDVRNIVREIHIDEKLEKYIIDLVFATRNKENSYSHYIRYGASPRASIYLLHTCKARAFMDNRGYVIPDDIKHTAYPVLRHRIIMSYEAEADSITADNVINEILNMVEVP
ncbi:MoxR family ATPase [candidate division WOR-3 bacterium]|jgi:MoxR-like ATPase|nr:MoxR family ATPase [candidate division WOR-3 bacterium]